MTKQEFEERIEATVSASQYDLIEEVYTFHPSISNVDGKEQIATIYKMFGMRIIFDMIPTAREAKRLDLEMRRASGVLEQLKSELAELKKGY